MRKVILDISMSLDGFTAGPHITLNEPLGKGGEQLHKWMFGGKTGADDVVVKEMVNTSGAVILGANTWFGAIDKAWNGVSPFAVPAFVVTHRQPQNSVTGFNFVHDGILCALAKARAAAGGKNVWVMGGAGIGRQFLQEGLLDELHLHIAPVLLRGGTRLFANEGLAWLSLEKIRTVDTPFATHIYFRMPK